MFSIRPAHRPVTCSPQTSCCVCNAPKPVPNTIIKLSSQNRDGSVIMPAQNNLNNERGEIFYLLWYGSSLRSCLKCRPSVEEPTEEHPLYAIFEPKDIRRPPTSYSGSRSIPLRPKFNDKRSNTYESLSANSSSRKQENKCRDRLSYKRGGQTKRDFFLTLRCSGT